MVWYIINNNISLMKNQLIFHLYNLESEYNERIRNTFKFSKI
jgi:hypothetical protein